MLQWFRKDPPRPTPPNGGGDLHQALIKKLIEFLSSQIPSPKKARGVLSHISRFMELPPDYQEKELPALYLKIEQFLVHHDPQQKLTPSQLRKTVRYRYEPLMELPNFSLIFEPSPNQEFLLCQFFLKILILYLDERMDESQQAFVENLAEWIYRVPNVQESPFPEAPEVPQSPDPHQWIDFLSDFSAALYKHLESVLPTEAVKELYEKSYREIAEIYQPLETFSVILQLLPENLLDGEKLNLLDTKQLRKILGWKLGELHRLKNDLKRHREETRELQNELQVTQNTAMESVKLLHAVLGAVQQGVVSTDSSGEIILVNPQICEMYGYSEEELVGKNIQILMPEKYREPHRQGLERYRKTRKSRAIGQRLILEGLRKDNSIFPLELYLTETQVGDRIIFTAAMRNISQEVKKEEEQKKATEELRFAERRFRHLLEVTDNIVFTLSLDGTFTHINPALTRRTGWAAEEWLNRPFIELVHPESATGVLKHFQQVMKGQKVTLEEVHIRTREDETLITRLNLIPLEFGGKITGALGVLQDETVRQKARQALKAGEARYRTFLENAPVGIAIEQEGKVVFVNPAAARMLELPEPGAMVGRSLTELAAPEGRPAFRAAILNVLKANQKPIRREEKFVTPSGKEILVEVVTQKTIYKGKKAVQFFLRDLTTVAELQSLRQVASDRLRFLLETIPRPALLQDSEGFIVDANAAAAELLGTKRSSLMGKVVLQFIPRPEREKFTAQMADLLNGRQETGEIGLVNATGEPIPVAMQARRIELPEKPLQLVLLEDLRPHKAREQEQESLQRRHEELRLRAEQLQNEVATLQEKLRAVGQLVPVCASCKKVRDDQGFWRRLESFVEDPGNAELLFGICPECSDQAHSRAVTNNARTDTR